MKNFIAKSKAKNNGVEVSLIDHLIETAEKCASDSLKRNGDPVLAACSYIVGFAHDLGKVTTDFQNHIHEDSVCEYDHSYVSAYIIKNFIKFNANLRDWEDSIIRAVLNHHPIIHNNANIRSLITPEVLDFVKEWVAIYKNTEYGKEYTLSFIDEYSEEVDIEGLDYYWFKNNIKNSKLMYLTSTLRHADILVSNKSIDENKLTDFHQYMPEEIIKPINYDERFFEQKELAIKAYEKDFSMLVALAGWGKTMAGLIYLLQGNKKGYWVCPRIEITDGIYDGVSNELKALGLYDKVSIAKMVTGRYIESNDNNLESYENGTMIPDITIINIDSFLRPAFNTDSNIRISSFIDSNCIFDEFHEYLTDCAILSMYHTIMSCRYKYCPNAKTLLLTASPEEVLFKNFIGEDTGYNDHIFYGHCDRMRDRIINVTFGSELESVVDEDHIIFVKSVNACQNIKYCELVNNIIHARYIDIDRKKHMQEVYKHHGKVSKNRNKSLVSTEVIGTGLDLTFNHMTIAYPTPNDILQKPGRLDRYSNMSNVTLRLIQPESIKKSEICTIARIYDKKLQSAYYTFLKERLTEGEHTKGELYDLANEFKKLHREDMRRMYDNFMAKSLEFLSKIKYRYTSAVNDDDDTIFTSNKNSLRSDNPDNIFILIPDSDMKEPMQVDLNNDNFIEEAVLRNNINGTKKLVMRYNGNFPYYKNDFAMKRSFNGKDPYGVLKNKARCNKTPYLIPNECEYEYTEELGLRKK